MKPNKRIAIVMSAALVNAIPTPIRREMDHAGAHIFRNDLWEVQRGLSGIELDCAIPVGISPDSDVFVYVLARVRQVPE